MDALRLRIKAEDEFSARIQRKTEGLLKSATEINAGYREINADQDRIIDLFQLNIECNLEEMVDYAEPLTQATGDETINTASTSTSQFKDPMQEAP
jgi:hypothetical protein